MAPTALIFVGLVALFRPGLFATDGLEQWYEGKSLIFQSQHPPLMGLIWAGIEKLTGGIDTFVALSIFCLVFGVYRIISRRTSNNYVATGLTFFVVCFPAVFSQLGQLHKDAVGAHFLLFGFSLLPDDPADRSRRLKSFAAVCLLALAALTRYQYLIPALVILLGAAFYDTVRHEKATLTELFWAAGSRILQFFLVGLALVIVISNCAAVTWKNNFEVNRKWVYLQDLGGISSANPSAQLSTLKLSSAADFTEHSRLSYLPASNVPMMHDKFFQDLYAAFTVGELEKQWKASILANPGIFLRNRLSSLERLLGFHDICWPLQQRIARPTSNELESMRAEAVGLAGLPDPVVSTFFSSVYFPVNYILFRPFIYLLAIMVVLTIKLSSRAARKSNSSEIILGSAALFYAATFVLATPSCDVRYLYWPTLTAVVLIALAMVDVWRSRSQRAGISG
jgi:hypothetical protein